MSSQGGHSAQVKMLLLVNGLAVPVAQLGPDFLLLDAPLDLPAGDASMVMHVDESVSRWDMRLPDGSSAASCRVAIALRA